MPNTTSFNCFSRILIACNPYSNHGGIVPATFSEFSITLRFNFSLDVVVDILRYPCLEQDKQFDLRPGIKDKFRSFSAANQAPTFTNSLNRA